MALTRTTATEVKTLATAASSFSYLVGNLDVDNPSATDLELMNKVHAQMGRVLARIEGAA